MLDAITPDDRILSVKYPNEDPEIITEILRRWQDSRTGKGVPVRLANPRRSSLAGLPRQRTTLAGRTVGEVYEAIQRALFGE